jgi:hypothetical protein
MSAILDFLIVRLVGTLGLKVLCTKICKAKESKAYICRLDNYFVLTRWIEVVLILYREEPGKMSFLPS